MTKSYRPWTVIYNEFYKEKKDALKREGYLKSEKGREWIWAKINEQLESNSFITNS